MFKIEKQKFVSSRAETDDEVFNGAVAAFKDILTPDDSFFIPVDLLEDKSTTYFIAKLAKKFPKAEGVKILVKREYEQPLTLGGERGAYLGIRFWRREFNVENYVPIKRKRPSAEKD